VSPRKLFSGEEIVRALERGGFTFRSQQGSHVAMVLVRDNAPPLLVIVPTKPEVPKGTFFSILKMAELSYEQFLDLANVRRKGRS